MSQAIRPMHCEQLFHRLKEKQIFALLDVRQPFERSLSRIVVPPEVVDLFVPMDEIADQLIEMRKAVGELDLVVYCHHGVRSRFVAEWLANQNFSSLANLEGGIDQWSKTIDPKTPRY